MKSDTHAIENIESKLMPITIQGNYYKVVPSITGVYKFILTNLEEVKESISAIIAQLSTPKGMGPGQVINLIDVPDEYSALLTNTFMKGFCPENLTLNYKNQYKMEANSKTLELLAEAIAAEKMSPGLTLIFDNFLDEENIQYLHRNQSFPKTSLKISLIIKDTMRYKGFFRYCTFQLPKILRSSHIIRLQLPLIDSYVIENLPEVLQLNDTLLEIKAPEVEPFDAQELKKATYIQQILIRNRMAVDSVNVPIVALLNQYFPKVISPMIISYFNEGYEDFIKIELPTTPTDLAKEIFSTRLKGNKEYEYQYWRIFARRPDLVVPVWKKFIECLSACALPIQQSAWAMKLWNEIEMIALQIIYYNLTTLSAKEKIHIFNNAFELLKKITFYIQPQKGFKLTLAKSTIIDCFSYRQIKELMYDEKPKFASQELNLITLIKEDKNYQEKSSAQINPDQWLEQYATSCFNSRDVVKNWLIEIYLQDHISLETLFNLCEAVSLYLDVRAIRTDILDNLLRRYSENKGFIKKSLDYSTQSITELQKLQMKMRGQSHISQFNLELLLSVYEQRNLKAKLSTQFNNIFHRNTATCMRELSKLTRPFSPS